MIKVEFLCDGCAGVLSTFFVESEDTVTNIGLALLEDPMVLCEQCQIRVLNQSFEYVSRDSIPWETEVNPNV